MNNLLPLSALRNGEIASIRQVVGASEQVRRLEELGLRHGVRLEMLRGGPTCIVRVGSSKLCLRGGESLCVMVEARLSA